MVIGQLYEIRNSFVTDLRLYNDSYIISKAGGSLETIPAGTKVYIFKLIPDNYRVVVYDGTHKFSVLKANLKELEFVGGPFKEAINTYESIW